MLRGQELNFTNNIKVTRPGDGDKEDSTLERGLQSLLAKQREDDVGKKSILRLAGWRLHEIPVS